MKGFIPATEAAKVVLFSGGRGSRVLSKELIRNPRVQLTVAINGYDDGASTGEIRRFLGDSLGPSDFRKNATRMARQLQSCPESLIDFMEFRFPQNCDFDTAMIAFSMVCRESVSPSAGWLEDFQQLLAKMDQPPRSLLHEKLECFRTELNGAERRLSFSDCSVGNLVFAGCFLQKGRNFNHAIEEFCSVLGLKRDLILNVTDGTNAYLVAIDRDYKILGSEAEIVQAGRRNFVLNLFLTDRLLTDAEQLNLKNAGYEEILSFLEQRSVPVKMNPQLNDRIAEADLIIYSPGTQHSSLFPSYMTPGLGIAISRNLTAIKLLITNVQEDAEIPGSSAVDLIEKAVCYLREKDRVPIPTPCLITHYLINDPRRLNGDVPYIPLGRLESLEDPRLIRIGDYEDGITGVHDAAKVLTPFVESILSKRQTRRVAVLLTETTSLNKISQTILEMLRSGIHELPVTFEVFYSSAESLDPEFQASIPFPVRNSGNAQTFLGIVRKEGFDYVILFDSSGMYRGEDIVNVAALLNHRRLDAVWGSRRLSITDVHESYKLRYRHNIALGAASYIGSHVLSLSYLLLYGRYISDTLSGARAIRASFLTSDDLDLDDHCLNQKLLSKVMRYRGEIFETPVQFFSISPEKVRRTTVLDGIRSMWTIFRTRFSK